MSQFPQITPNRIVERAPILIETQRPMMVLGAPGTAKTHAMRQLVMAMAAYHNVDISEVGHVEFAAPDRDPYEVNGLAVPSKTEDGVLTTKFTRSPLLQLVLDTGKAFGVIQVEEITSASTDMQKALRHLVDSDTRKLGMEKIPDGWIVVLTGNRLADKAGAGKLLSHFANACSRYEMRFDINGWTEWAENNSIHPMLIACVNALHDDGLFADTVPAEDVQFNSPRTLSTGANDIVSRMTMVDGIPQQGPYDHDDIAAWIGDDATDKVLGFFATAHRIPKPADILLDPLSALVDPETAMQYAAGAVATGIATDTDSGEAALKYLTRLRPEIQISAGAALLRKSHRDGFLMTGPTANEFVAKHHDLLPLTAAA
jgi:hypothetical protein